MTKKEHTKDSPDIENLVDENEVTMTDEDSVQDEADLEEGAETEEAGLVAELEGQLDELKDTYLRVLAEYDNYRKRTAREKKSHYTYAKAETIKRILPVYDNLERAVENPTTDDAYKKGVELIFQQLKEVFADLDVTEIEAEGEKFNPEKHNAVMHIEDEQFGENTVAEVFQRGFEIDDYVIRHAVVKVAN